MPRYSYEGFDAAGEMSKGDLEAPSEAAALSALASRGVTPISLQSGATQPAWWAREISLTGAAQTHKSGEVERFFATFAALMAARLPLVDSLKFCARQTRDARMRHSLDRVARSVENGATLRDALRDESGLFAERLVTLVGIGEASNTLPDIAQRIAELLLAEAVFYREIRGAMVYPAILMITATAVMAVLVFYLVPTLAPVFASAGASLPLPLKLMLALRSALLEHWMITLGLLVTAGGALIFSRKALMTNVTPLMRHLPVIGPLMVQHATLEVCRNLHLMLSSGATLTTAIATTRDAARSPRTAAMMGRALNAVQSGASLSDHLSTARGFDPVAAAMVQAGEQSDQLGAVLGRISEDLGQRATRQLKQLVQLTTPVMTLLIGGSIGLVVLSTISAIMDLNDLAF